MGLTQWRFVANSIAQKIPGAHCGQLRETFHEPLGLCSFANARRTDENNASSAFELLSGHSEEVDEVGMRSGGVRRLSMERSGWAKLLVAAGEARSFWALYTTASC